MSRVSFCEATSPGIYFANLCAVRALLLARSCCCSPLNVSVSLFLLPATVGSNLQVNRLRRFVTRPSLAPRPSLGPSRPLVLNLFRLVCARPSNWLVSLFLSLSLSFESAHVRAFALYWKLYVRASTDGKDTKTSRKRGVHAACILPPIRRLNVLIHSPDIRHIFLLFAVISPLGR